MATFTDTDDNDIANAAIGELTGFSGGSVAELQDGIGDNFWGSGGDDFVFAANADDVIEGGEGHDVLNGGAGDDVIYGNIELEVNGSLVGDELVGNDGNDELFGSNGGDSIDGGAGVDTIRGGGGDDLLQGGLGGAPNLGDRLAGGEGNDTIYAYGIGQTNENSFNALQGENGNDALIGANGADNLEGGAGADTLHGGFGDDRLFFSAGDVFPGEIIDGEGGFDSFIVSGAVTFKDAASIAGIEAVSLSDGATATFGANQVKTSLPTNLLIDGAAVSSSETFSVEMDAETVLDVAGFGLFQNWGATDRVVIVGDVDDEFIAGTVQIDQIFGNAGDDTLVGGVGVDQLFGGLGNDVYLVDQAAGEAVELAGQGNDGVLAFFSHTLAANVENLTLLGTGSINGTGNTLANMIVGNSGANFLNGGAGVDALQGGLGNDTYLVDNAGDLVTEAAGQGTDTIRSTITKTLPNNVENLLLLGTGNIDGAGNRLDNRIVGNSGANTLNGLAGNDVLIGNGGADRFLFTTALNTATNVDTVADFQVGRDEIRLDNAIFTGLPLGDLAAGRFHIGTKAADASDRIIYNSTTGSLLFDADGTGGAAQTRFATLDTGLALTAGDFFVV